MDLIKWRLLRAPHNDNNLLECVIGDQREIDSCVFIELTQPCHVLYCNLLSKIGIGRQGRDSILCIACLIVMCVHNNVGKPYAPKRSCRFH